MAAKTKAKPKPTRDRQPIPVGEWGWLNIDQVLTALGGCSLRKFVQLRKTGGFPAPDRHLGRFPRWTVSTVRKWCEEHDAANDDDESEA